MTSVDVAGNVGPARKATGFMTNDEFIAEAVDRRCFGGNDHTRLLNGRAKAFEKYPLRLVAAILRALRQRMRAAGCGEAQGLMGRDRQLTIAALEAGPTLEEPELLSLPDTTGGALEFRDRTTGLPLNPEMIKRARELEMQCVDEPKVLEDSDRDTCMAETSRPPIPTCWVDIDKGDSLQERVGLSRDTWAINNWCGRFCSDVRCNSSVRDIPSAAELDDDRPKVTSRRK